MFQTLAGLRVYKTLKRGRTTYIIAPWAKCCLNCKHYLYDQVEKVHVCLKGHDLVGELGMDLTKSCKDFEKVEDSGKTIRR